jgi:hypothetical protein
MEARKDRTPRKEIPMQLRTRWALGAAALSIAALAGAAPAQAAPAFCSTRAFQAVDTAVRANPQASANLLSFTYRFAPRQSEAGFDTLVQCDVTAAKSVYNAFKAINLAEANSFQTAFKRDYAADANSVFGGVVLIT